MRSDIKIGNSFPDYELQDHTGSLKKLSQIQGRDPLVLILARGSYCPKEELQHEYMVAMQREFKVGYCKIATISTDNQMQTLEWRTRLGAHWPFLWDEKRQVQKDLDIKEYTDPVHDPMIPHTLILKPNLEIFKIYNGYWYWGRPTPEEIRQDLRKVSKEIRPDWDLSVPGMKEKWEHDQKEYFYPYSK
jgi:peroxiredoxin